MGLFFSLKGLEQKNGRLTVSPVVEDIPNILELLDPTLRFNGYEVVTARNGQEALEVIESRRPALIITDILMPRMDGFSLIHRLRTNRET